MATDYCDRSVELLKCAQLLHQKVMSGRVILKPRVSQPGAVAAYFAPTLLKTQFLPLIKQVSVSLTLCQAKMDQLVSLTDRYNTSSPPDSQLATSISNLAQKLQPEVVAISGFLQRVAALSTQVQQEFSSHPQVCKHVRALVSSQESRLADLSMHLRDFMETNKAIVMGTLADTEESSIPIISTSAVMPPLPTSLVSSIPRPPSSHHTKQAIPVVEPLRRDETPIIVQDQSHLLLPSSTQQMVVRQRDNSAALRHTEATIVQLGEIYQQFSFLVKEQGDLVARIDSNLEDANLNVSFAHDQLAEFLRYVSSRRAFMLKFFAVLMAIFCLFAIFKR
uniref:t-SNARE coiled-coil homology domain-containing protein n=1 Tax=Mesocestoides corti TaxID=53468 RepID=A0A5K3FST4_MESCO